MGPDFDAIDWKEYDPRQYDSRRIVREALMDPIDDAPVEKPQSGVMAPSTRQVYDASKPTPGTPTPPDCRCAPQLLVGVSAKARPGEAAGAGGQA